MHCDLQMEGLRAEHEKKMKESDTRPIPAIEVGDHRVITLFAIRV